MPDELTHHLGPQALPKVIGVRKELVDADDAWIMFVGPPTVALLYRDIGLDETYGRPERAPSWPAAL